MCLLLHNANRKFVLTSERGGPKPRQQYHTVPERVPLAVIFNMSALALYVRSSKFADKSSIKKIKLKIK